MKQKNRRGDAGKESALGLMLTEIGQMWHLGSGYLPTESQVGCRNRGEGELFRW